MYSKGWSAMRLRKICLALVMSTISACALKTKVNDPPVTDANVPKATAPAAAATEHIDSAAETQAEKHAVSDAKDSNIIIDTLPAKVVDESPAEKKAEHKKEKGVPAKQSMLWLEHGNSRFVTGHIRKDG